MYAETGGLMFPYFHNFPQQFEDFYCSHKPNVSSGIPSCVIQTSAVSDYNLWAEGDLFKAPEPVIEEPAMGLDPVTAAISMISCGEDVMPTQSLAVSDIESSIQSGQLLSEVFYECRKDLLAKEGNEMPLSEVLNIKIPTDENMTADEKLVAESPFQKSISSSCLRSMECVTEALVRPNFLDFPVMDFGAAYGMRRAFSEGDIKTLGNGNINFQSPMEQPKIMSAFTSEDRKEKLSRYRNKKSKRNFGRKIKYACRKALADSQPRIRGRFAKTEDTETSKKR
ncbi:UNVERIFIED_CONTAM: Zinc finger protein CO3 [Sesamum radiatum]|uniref:Zinc finger protein CO3 n=1 Tax=Sesamum radiatum TaxID=300843 RepID=A0AAW2JZZ9_SESRA